MKNKLSEGDIVLLLLYANNCSPIRGRTRFQKILFVFEKEIYTQYAFDKGLTGQQSFNFCPYNYGPFSVKAYKLLEFFINIGMVEKNKMESEIEFGMDGIGDYQIINSDIEQSGGIEDVTLPSINIDENYGLSVEGKNFVEKNLLLFYKDDRKEVLDNFKIKLSESSLGDILKYVYSKYPDMTIESKIRDEVLK